MTDNIKMCPNCGQHLRIPENIGGMLMACPQCGHRFHSDFKLGYAKRKAPRHIFKTLFEMPYDILSRIRRYFASK